MNGKMAKRLRKIAKQLAAKFEVPDESTQTLIATGARVRRDRRQIERRVKGAYQKRRTGGGDATRISLPLTAKRKPTEVDRVTSQHGQQNDRSLGTGADGGDRIRGATLRALRAEPVPAGEAGQVDPRAVRSGEATPAGPDGASD